MSPLEPFGGPASLVRLAGLLFIAACDATVVSIGAVPAPATTADAALDVALADAALEVAPADAALDVTPADAPFEATETDGAEDVVPIDGSTGIYLEAESGMLSGFSIVGDSTASAGQFIAPPDNVTSDTQPGAARGVYAIDITTAGTYLIWGRIHSPDGNHNRAWIQVDGGSWHLWRITTGDIWYWNFIHDNTNYYTPLTFDLTAGPHQLVVANAAADIGLDRWYVALRGDAPPQTDTPCRPPNSIPLSGVCVPSCGSLGGTTCGTTFCAGRVLTPHVYDCPVCCY